MAVNIDSRATTRSVWRAAMWGGLLALLLLPALAMSRGAEGVDWSASDFVIMGTLMAILGLAIEVAVRFLTSWKSRLMAVVLAVFGFLLIWMELAVGLIGTPFAGS